MFYSLTKSRKKILVEFRLCHMQCYTVNGCTMLQSCKIIFYQPRVQYFLGNCFIGGASRYIRVIKTNLIHYLSSVYFVNQPLHVSGMFVAHHQEVYCIYTTVGTCCALQLTVCWSTNRQSTEKHNTYQLLYIYSIPPDDMPVTCRG